MSRTLLFECAPRGLDGVAVPVRLCWKAPGAAAFFGQHWHPAVSQPPSLENSIGFDGQRFGILPAPQVGDLVFALPPQLRHVAGLVWRDAPITIRQAIWPAGPVTSLPDAAFTTIWQGLAEDISVDDGLASVRLIDAGQALRTPFAATKFGSSGIALLDSDAAAEDRAAGRVVPMAFGRCFSVPGLLVDRVNNIWLFSGRPATAVTGFYDGGAAFTLGVARASLAALIATPPAAGRVDWCLDAGGLFLARPWDEPVYPFTCDATFGGTLAGDIAATLVAGRLPMLAGTVAAFNAAVPAACGLYVDDESTTAVLLDRLLAGLGAFWRVHSSGAVALRRIGWGAGAISVPAHRRSAPRRLRIVMPTAKRSLGYARNNRVHSESEIAQILLAEDIVYGDGTPVQDLQPAGPGADATGQNDPRLVLPAPVEITFQHTGALVVGQLPRTIQARRERGTTDVTDSTTWSIAATGCAATIQTAGDANPGRIEITAATGTGKIVVTAVRDGVTLTGEVAVIRKDLPPPVTSGANASALVNAALTTSSYGPVLAELFITLGAAGQAVLSAPLTISVSSGTSEQLARGKWMRETSPGTYADVGSEAISAPGAIGAPEPVEGSLSVSATVTGLTPSSNQRFRLFGRRSSGSNAMNFFGTASASGS